jgi:hypothetical protein
MPESRFHPCERSSTCRTPALRWIEGTCGLHATDEEIDAYLRIDRSARHHPSAL